MWNRMEIISWRFSAVLWSKLSILAGYWGIRSDSLEILHAWRTVRILTFLRCTEICSILWISAESLESSLVMSFGCNFTDCRCVNRLGSSPWLFSSCFSTYGRAEMLAKSCSCAVLGSSHCTTVHKVALLCVKQQSVDSWLVDGNGACNDML